MGIVVTLRNPASKMSYFKEILLSLMNSGEVDNMLISSGYIYENLTGENICKSLSFDGISMIKCINDCVFSSVTVVGSRDDRGKGQENFVKNLKDNCPRVTVTGAYHRNNKWHAKICILRKGDDALAGIIGSSNLTKSAYSYVENSSSYEGDAFIFSKKVDSIVLDKVKQLRDGQNHLPEGILVADYSPDNNGGLSEEDVLNRYHSNILDEVYNSGDFEII